MKTLNKEAIKKEFDNVIDFDIQKPNNIGISDLSHHLENKGLINFTIEDRETQTDNWLQAEYYNEIIRKPIIVNYNVSDHFGNFDEFFYELEYINNSILKIEKIIK